MQGSKFTDDSHSSDKETEKKKIWCRSHLVTNGTQGWQKNQKRQIKKKEKATKNLVSDKKDEKEAEAYYFIAESQAVKLVI